MSVQTAREQVLVIVTERERRDRLVMIDECSHELAALQHVPDLDRVAAARGKHVRRGKEQNVLDRLAVVHAQHDRVGSRVNHLHRVIIRAGQD